MRRCPNLPRRNKEAEQEEFTTIQLKPKDSKRTILSQAWKKEPKEDLLDMDFSDEFAALKEMEETSGSTTKGNTKAKQN